MSFSGFIDSLDNCLLVNLLEKRCQPFFHVCMICQWQAWFNQKLLDYRMNRSLKGALLSGLVFPGLGQLVLGVKKRGWLLILAVVFCLGVIVVSATQKALAILEILAEEGKPLNIESISEAAVNASTTSGSNIFNVFFLVLVLCWLFSIVDAYRIGARQDQK